MKLPQLSLRELFLLVVIAAMGCGWWVERSRQADLEKRHAQSQCNLKTALHVLKTNGWHWFGDRENNLPDGDLVLYTRD